MADRDDKGREDRRIRPKPEYSFDDECYYLAEHFYPDYSVDQLNELAQQIQNTVEGFEHDLKASA